jgi:serine/threonine-protein kinase RsbW
VLLYTDGLIERRSRSLEEGMGHLLAEAAIHRDCSPARLTDQIVRALRSPEHADDVCLLAACLREHRSSG